MLLFLEALLLAAIVTAALVPDVGRIARSLAAPVVEPIVETFTRGDDARRAEPKSAAPAQERRDVRGAVAASSGALAQPQFGELASVTRVETRQGLLADPVYHRLALRADDLADRIRALLRGGVTAAEKPVLLRLRIALGEVQRDMILRRIARLREGGLTAEEREQVARLQKALALLDRTIVQRRIALVLLGGVESDEEATLRRLQDELAQVEQTIAQLFGTARATSSPSAGGGATSSGTTSGTSGGAGSSGQTDGAASSQTGGGAAGAGNQAQQPSGGGSQAQPGGGAATETPAEPRTSGKGKKAGHARTKKPKGARQPKADRQPKAARQPKPEAGQQANPNARPDRPEKSDSGK